MRKLAALAFATVVTLLVMRPASACDLTVINRSSSYITDIAMKNYKGQIIWHTGVYVSPGSERQFEFDCRARFYGDDSHMPNLAVVHFDPGGIQQHTVSGNGGHYFSSWP